MRFFHLSDLHIGRQLYQYSLIEDQRYILSQIIERVREYKPQAIILAGDIYDKTVPSAEAVEVFDGFLTELSKLPWKPEIMIIAGNHDSAQRLNYGSSLLSQLHVHIAALPPKKDEYMKHIRLEDEYGPVEFYMMPFVKPPYIRHLLNEGEEAKTYDAAVRALIDREDIDDQIRNIIAAHQFFIGADTKTETCDSEIVQVGGLDQVDVAAMEIFEYAALGHIHGSQNVGEGRFRYCGSPLKYSVSEAGHQKSLTMVDLKEKGSNPEITKIPLVSMRDVRVIRGELDEILNHAVSDEHKMDYVSITLTDELEQMDARDRLLASYPNLLEVQVDNTRTRQQMEEDYVADRMLTPDQIFAEFFEGIQGRALNDDERVIMEKMINLAQDDVL